MTLTGRERLLFIHTVKGCDSGIFEQGKVRLLKKLGNSEKLEYVFYELGMANNDRENIVENWIILFQYIIGDINNTLPELWLHEYNFMTTDNTRTFRLLYLRPTEGAAVQHALRSYLQYHDSRLEIDQQYGSPSYRVWLED